MINLQKVTNFYTEIIHCFTVKVLFFFVTTQTLNLATGWALRFCELKLFQRGDVHRITEVISWVRRNRIFENSVLMYSCF
jgi:hypothetical protein